MKIKSLVFGVIISSLMPFLTTAQKIVNPLLQSGPMLGYADMREAMIWLQTTREAEVFVVYCDVTKPNRNLVTNKVKTSKSEAFTAHLVADSVEPGHQYKYQVFINRKPVKLPYNTQFSTPPIWKWRTDPPEFTMLTGSCAYINQPEYDRAGKPYGGDYKIFTGMAAQKADFMLWLGDNLYLREPDWNSASGIAKRYTHTRSVQEMQPFLASTHHYAIWDDHDYGPDNSNESFYYKNQTLEAFRQFWGNPTYGVGDIEGAITSFQWGDADFFLLDNRWYREPDELNNSYKTVLGEKQLNWLLENLVTSKATFKIVAMGGQFLSDAAENAEAYSAGGFNKEREIIINFIYQYNIKNVVFITGDVHYSEISVLKKEGKPAIYDLTFSALTSGPNTSGESWKNTLRIPGTVVMERNYGMIKFSGPAKARKLTVSCLNSDNKKCWEQVIEQE